MQRPETDEDDDESDEEFLRRFDMGAAITTSIFVVVLIVFSLVWGVPTILRHLSR